MGYANETGYVPVTFNGLMDLVMEGANTQFGTSYTSETFVGTDLYKYMYAAVQKMSEVETKASEVFLKVQTYFDTTNEMIQRPATTPDGIVDTFLSNEFEASVKPMIEADAGMANICVNVDDTLAGYADLRAEIAEIIRTLNIAGVVTVGTETELITLTNGQEFDFNFHLPNKFDIHLKLTLTTSRNNRSVILTPEESKATLLENVAAEYKMGLDFEPERYFTKTDAPWASDILLEYRKDVPATGTIEITNYANLLDDVPDEITVHDVAFVAQAGAVTAGEATFQAATSNEATAASLLAQIRAHASTNPMVKTSIAGAVVTLTAREQGTDGNSIVLLYSDEDDDGTSVGATVSGSGTLAGGAEGSFASAIYESTYNELFLFDLANITIVEA